MDKDVSELIYFTIVVIPLTGDRGAWEAGQKINALYAKGFRAIDEQIIAHLGPLDKYDYYMIVSLERLDEKQDGSEDGTEDSSS